MNENDKILLEELENSGVSFLSSPRIIYVAKKTLAKVEKHIPDSDLKKVAIIRQNAIDKCMLFISHLTSTFYHEEGNGWKHMCGAILQRNMGKNYPRIREVLEKHGIIECNDAYDSLSDFKFSKSYRLTERYYKGGTLGVVPYEVTSELVLKSMARAHDTRFKDALSNPISRNLLKAYANVTLPTREELMESGMKLVGTMKGRKTYQTLTETARVEGKEAKKVRFIEDDIDIFERLTKNGFLVPIITGKKAGGRVVDSFNLMPSWIRKHVKFGEQETAEADYSCLHPNIVSKVYGGSEKFITHDKVAEDLGVSREEVKIEHLSFFNKEYHSMKQSPLWNYYSKKDPDMLGRVVGEKAEEGYRMTSQRLFKEETKLMSEAIKILNGRGIYVLYIFDAIVCRKRHREEVADVMNYVAERNGVYTTVN